MSSNWEHERRGLLETVQALPSLGYYYGNITIEEAELILKKEPNGAFLVRDSSDSDNIRDIFTITFKIQNCFGSVRIDYAKGLFSLSLADPGLPMFSTLMGLVSHCLECSIVLKKPVCVLTGHSQNNNVNLYLTKPVSRHTRMHSLLFLCRASVHGYVTQDKLEKLGLPAHLQQHYMMRNPYFDEHCSYETEPDQVSQGTQSSASGSLRIDTGNGNSGNNEHTNRS